MNNLIKKIFLLFFIFSVLSFNACSSLGPVYQKTDKIPNGMGLVYVYRPSAFLGFALSPNLYTNKGQTFLTAIPRGGYFPYYSKPGNIDFSVATETESSVTLNTKAGQTYFIKMIMSHGIALHRPNLKIVSAEQGEKEIQECKLIPKQN